MSTFIDGAPPSVTPGPDDGEPAADGPGDTGPAWLQEEIRRRMAERRSGAGGRHARRDPAGEPPGGVGHVPRHSVATPGPGAPAPSPIGGPSLPPSGAPVRRRRPADPGESWSGPGTDDEATPGGRRIPRAYRPGARGVPSDAPATFGGPAFADGATRRPPSDEFGGPEFAAAQGDLDDRDDAPVSTVVALGPGAVGAREVPPPADPTGPDADLPAPDLPGPDLPGPDLPGLDGTPLDRTALGEPAPDGATPVDARGPDAPARPQAGSDVLPPRAPARLLAAPGAPVAPVPAAALPTTAMPTTALPRTGAPDPWSSTPRVLELVDRLDLTGPLTPVDDDAPGGVEDGDDTVLWSAHMPPVAPDGTALATPALPVDLPAPRPADPDETVADSGIPVRRVKVILSERRNQAHPVRTVVDIQEGGAVGELLRSNLIGSQLTVALRFALLAALTLGLLPLAFALFPEIGRTEVLGLRLPWLLLGVLVYPFLLGLGWWHTRTAERVEQNFADHVQD
ncbi:hypothetical protein GCM10017691_62070 [Pseudonocardia petroleophila]|uniref:hypothetical protein n=1 Tax=Pseudonocardia petroleophila TaxID=37331 RepID=UPI001C8BCE73|nr:hypothetical protein [Pseudonocardia petroleophila]